MIEKPLIAILDNNDQLLCVTKDYFDGNLHTFLQGTAAFFSCSIVQRLEMSQHFKVGNKISFVYDEIAYHFDITDMVKNETYVTIQADTLTLELRNEDSAEYKAAKAMTFEEYLKVFLFAPDNPTVMGINEVSDKKFKLEWEGSEESVLARLFSLASKFDAEIEFVTKLNRHWGLDKIVLNVYKANDDKHQGIGKDRQDMILEYGNNVETIEIHENIDNLKTSIKPVGKDGLTVKNVVIDEKDHNGNRLFYSPKGDHVIRAVQARDQFRSKLGLGEEGYIAKNWSFETDNENTLAGQALAELKKLSKVELTVTIKAYEKLNIGDTVRAQNKAYQPTLNLSVRVSEQDIYFEEPSKNTTTFTNVEILKSEVDASLLSRVQELIKANKKYEYQIISDNGTVFKNNQGQTTLAARVLDGVKDITDDLILSWSKDGKAIGSNKELTVNASEITNKAVYRYDVADETGLVIGGYEVTVTNINDGKEGKPGTSGETMHLYTAWAEDYDGKGITIDPPKPNMLTVTDFSSKWYSSQPTVLTSSIVYGNVAKLTKNAVITSRPVYLLPRVNIDPLVPGRGYVGSIDINIDPGFTGTGDLGSIFFRNNGDPFDISTIPIPNDTKTGVWIRLAGTESIVKSINADGYFGIAFSADFVGTINIRNPKFEMSATPTPFIKHRTETEYVEPQYKYLGTYTDTNPIQSLEPAKYTWSDISGSDGKDGKDGVGKDGSSSFVHTAYSYAPDGSKWFGTQYPNINLFRDQYVLKNTKIGKQTDTTLSYIIREAWGETFIKSARIKDLFEPSTVYTIQYSFELLTNVATATPYAQQAHGTLLLYNPKTKVSISLGGQTNNVEDAKTWVVGTIRNRSITFTTPADMTDWVVLCYTLRSMTGTTFIRNERGRFFDIKLEKGSEATLITTNPSDNEDLALPMYTGTYVDTVKADSTDPSKYTWVLNRDVSKIHMAWANASDKSDIVTKWPNPNIMPYTHGLISMASNDQTNYPAVFNDMTENGIFFRRARRSSVDKNPTVLSIYNGMPIDPVKYAGKRIAISYIARADKEYRALTMSYVNAANVATPNYDHYLEDGIGTEWREYSTIYESLPANSTIIRYGLMQILGANAATSYMDFAHFKIEILEPEQEPTSFIPYGTEPKFKCLGTYSDNKLKGDIRPGKYTWNVAQGKDGETGPPKYTWIAYADTVNGTDISLSSVGKRYIGFANNRDSSVASTTPSDYTWSELGDQKALDNLGNAVGSIPKTFVQSNTPVGAKNGDQWWVMTNNNITAYKILGNGIWYPQKIDQAIMNITQLNSVLINAATINGSIITNSYDVASGQDANTKVKGTISLNNAEVLNEGYMYRGNTYITTHENHLALDSLRMITYEGGSKAKPIGHAAFSALGISLVDPTTGYGGTLTAEQLTNKEWKVIPLASGYVVAEGATPEYRKIQNLNGSFSIEIRGRAQKSSGSFSSGTGTIVGTLPSDCRPTRLAMFPVAFSGGNVGRVQVSLEGQLQVQVNTSGVTTVMLDGIIMPL